MTRRSTCKTCPRCGRRIRACAFGRHLQSCAQCPPTAELREQRHVLRWSMQRMAKHHGVTRSRITRWLVDAGLHRPTAMHPLLSDIPQEEQAPALAPELAPLRNRRGLCNEDCSGWSECRARQVLGLWPLCSAPEQREVVLALWHGEITLEGQPEWLPAEMAELVGAPA